MKYTPFAYIRVHSRGSRLGYRFCSTGTHKIVFFLFLDDNWEISVTGFDKAINYL